MLRYLFVNTICALSFTPIVLGGFSLVAAQMMSSENFHMQTDSINIGGGSASSDNFQIEDTIGEVATGDSDSENFQLRAGFQQMQAVQISMSAPDPVLMDPSIPGVAGGFANGSTTVTVTTDSSGGYQIVIAAENSPALQATDSAATIGDYSPVGDSDYDFITTDNDSHMGYTILSAHAVDRFWNNETVCGTGGLNTGEHCWDGLNTTPSPVVSFGNSNHPDGTATKVLFRVGVGGSVLPTPGVYIATTTLTAISL